MLTSLIFFFSFSFQSFVSCVYIHFIFISGGFYFPSTMPSHSLHFHSLFVCSFGSYMTFFLLPFCSSHHIILPSNSFGLHCLFYFILLFCRGGSFFNFFFFFTSRSQERTNQTKQNLCLIYCIISVLAYERRKAV